MKRVKEEKEDEKKPLSYWEHTSHHWWENQVPMHPLLLPSSLMMLVAGQHQVGHFEIEPDWQTGLLEIPGGKLHGVPPTQMIFRIYRLYSAEALPQMDYISSLDKLGIWARIQHPTINHYFIHTIQAVFEDFYGVYLLAFHTWFLVKYFGQSIANESVLEKKQVLFL